MIVHNFSSLFINKKYNHNLLLINNIQIQLRIAFKVRPYKYDKIRYLKYIYF